jgi:hypothetical protein
LVQMVVLEVWQIVNLRLSDLAIVKSGGSDPNESEGDVELWLLIV